MSKDLGRRVTKSLMSSIGTQRKCKKKKRKITTIQWSKAHKTLESIQEFSQNEKAYKVLPFGEDNHRFQLKPLNKQSSMFGLKGT